jgi:D-glycero-D-manno-heptose 1,7-bisphosphate phosphatase
MARAVFLDRDGILNMAILRNGKPFSPTTPEEMIIVPAAAELLGRLRAAGFKLIVVTNQPDVARGKMSRSTVDAMNRQLCAALPIDAVEVCPHDNADNCDCRKPKPGMLLRAARTHDIDCIDSFMVGDRLSDIEAGQRAQCRTILVGDGYGEECTVQPEATVHNLRAAIEWILKQPSRAEASHEERR